MSRFSQTERAASSILTIGILLGAAFLLAILGAVGGAYVAHAELQQAADIAATAIEKLPGDAPRERAEELARANGARSVAVTTSTDGEQMQIRVVGRMPAAFGLRRGGRVEATAYATLPPPTAFGDAGPNPEGFYSGPIERVKGVPVCPAVAAAFRAMDAAAAGAGIALMPTSGFRGYAEQAYLYAKLGPGLAAVPGTSRHHDATELDIGVGPTGSATHLWLRANGPRFGFVQRYSWEPWHWGFVAGC